MAVSHKSWLVAPQCTNPAASGSALRTCSVNCLTNGIAGVALYKVAEARESSIELSEWWRDGYLAAAAGIIPRRPSTRARATSKRTMARRTEASEKITLAARLVVRLSMRRTGIQSKSTLSDRLKHGLNYTSKNTVSFSPHKRISKYHSPGRSGDFRSKSVFCLLGNQCDHRICWSAPGHR